MCAYLLRVVVPVYSFISDREGKYKNNASQVNNNLLLIKGDTPAAGTTSTSFCLRWVSLPALIKYERDP